VRVYYCTIGLLLLRGERVEGGTNEILQRRACFAHTMRQWSVVDYSAKGPKISFDVHPRTYTYAVSGRAAH
jgi:hypothetical protein